MDWKRSSGDCGIGARLGIVGRIWACRGAGGERLFLGERIG